jgi:hypothetical protein
LPIDVRIFEGNVKRERSERKEKKEEGRRKGEETKRLNIRACTEEALGAVFSRLECVTQPVARHALPGPTWGDLLRDFSRSFSDGGRDKSLDV